MLAVRLLLVLSVAALFASVQSACTPATNNCNAVSLTTTNGGSFQLEFLYDSDTGEICTFTAATFTINNVKYNAPIGSSPISTSPAQVTVDAGTFPLGATDGAVFIQVSLDVGLPATPSTTVGVVTIGVTTTTSGSQEASSIVTGYGTGAAPVSITFTGQTPTSLGTADGTPYFDSCSAVTTDPVFTGFHGQTFYLIGDDASVYNVLSASNMQLNTRLAQLDQGESMTRAEMKTARLKSLFTLPATFWWDHAGPYMAELGLAMVGGHKLYARAGPYTSGFNTLTLDGVNISLADSLTVGSGDNAVSISHPCPYRLIIETSLLKLTISNSDKFFNIDTAVLRSAEFDLETTPLGGALGQTADPKWKADNKNRHWRHQIEQQALIRSGDLFEMSSPAVF